MHKKHTKCNHDHHAHSHSHGHHHYHHDRHQDAERRQTERRAGHANNMHGVFLHILADTLGSVGVVVSSYLIKHYNWRIADPICAIVISALILASTWPLLRDTSLKLLSHKSKECAV